MNGNPAIEVRGLTQSYGEVRATLRRQKFLQDGISKLRAVTGHVSPSFDSGIDDNYLGRARWRNN